MNFKSTTKSTLIRIFFIYPGITICLFFLNYIFNNEIMKLYLKLDLAVSEHRYPCDLKDLPPIENGVIKFNNMTFNDGTGSCFKNKLEKVKIIEIKNSPGGSVNSARILSEEINKNNIDVQIKGYCFSACVDLLLHAKKRIVCKNSLIGIHQFSTEKKIKQSYLIHHYMLLKQKAMLNTIPDQSINTSFIENMMNKTGSEDIHVLTEKELIDNNIATDIINC